MATKNALMTPNEYGIVRNAQGGIEPMLSKWAPGSWKGTWTNTAETGGDPLNGGGLLPQDNLLGEDFWRQQGFQGQAFTPQTGGFENNTGSNEASPELQAWAAANGYMPGSTEGYGGILKDGQIVDGSYFGNQRNDDAAFYAAMLGIGGFGAAANSAGLGVDAAGNATGGAFGGGVGSGADTWGQTLAKETPTNAGYASGVDTAGAAGGGQSSFQMDPNMIGGGTSGGSSGFQLDPNSFGGANYTGGNMGNAGTSLADFFSGNGSTNDYLRAGQALYGLYSQNKATGAAQQGNQQALDLYRETRDQNRADNQPLLDLRNSVLPQINSLLKDPSSITQQPGYQFQLKQGQNQLNNRAAASGNYYSGQQIKAAQQYGQDYAGTKLDQSLNRLMGVATGTQVGGQNNQANNNQFAVSGGNALQQGGNIRAGGYLGQYNTVNNGVNNYLQDQFDRKYWGGGS